MVRTVILPKLGQTMEEGIIVEWLKQEGDPVQRGEVLFTTESDKATLEVESPTRGFLRKIWVPAGQTVPVLTEVALITRDADEDISAYAAQPQTLGSQVTEAASPVAAVSETPEPTGERVFASPRARRLAREKGVDLALVTGSGPNGRVKERDVLVYLAALPTATPVARRLAEGAGLDLRALRGSGPGGRVTKKDVEEALAALPAAAAAVPPAPREPSAPPEAASTLAEGAGLDLRALRGSGPGGRVTKKDVEEALAAVPAAAAAVPPSPHEPSAPAEAAPTLAELPMSGVRGVIARRMHESHRATAPVTLTTEADASAFVELRERLKGSLADELGFHLGYNDLLIKLAAHALRDCPYMNARLVSDGSGDSSDGVIHQLREINVALAVDTERGLLVPVIRDADRKRVATIARELRERVERARSGKALPDELSGSTFTITNLGMYEIDAFTPIINLPEAAILGVGRIKARPAVVDGEVGVRQMMWLSLTFDHRLVDGAPAARFLQRVKQLIEEPYLLLA